MLRLVGASDEDYIHFSNTGPRGRYQRANRQIQSKVAHTNGGANTRGGAVQETIVHFS